MDNLTHTLLGAAISRTGLNQKMKHATVTLMIAANLPDIDVISRAWGSLAYLKYHRGITHSMIGVTALGFLLAAITFFLQRRSWRKRPDSGPQPSFVIISAICLIGTWSHLLLDYTNSYGVRPFMPFSDRWVALDIEFIIDPIILAILILGLVLPSLFRMISEEIGERKKRRGRVGAVVSLLLIVCLWMVRDFNHRVAVQKLSAFMYRGENPIAVYALPRPANPFAWVGIVETAKAYYSLKVDRSFSVPRLNTAEVFYKPEESALLRAAQESTTGKTFLEFARLPIYSTAPEGENTQVTIRDLRFASATRPRAGFAAKIVVSKDLTVVSQKFSFAG